MSKTIINIMGPGRSGTTMLDLMLGNDDVSFSMGEVHALYHPFRKHHLKIDCNCGDENCIYWTKLTNTSERNLHIKAFDKFQVDYLIDSSKFLPWIIDSHDRAKRNKINTINFITYKPIKEYSYSIWKRGESLEDALYRYKLYYKRFFQSRIPAYSINYKDLVTETEITLDRIIEITGQQHNKERKSFWKKEHHHLFGSGGIRKQSREGSSEIRESESFPLEFEELFEDLESKINKDKELNLYLHRLKNMDISKEKWNPDELKLIKPYWYYFLKYRNFLSSILLRIRER